MTEPSDITEHRFPCEACGSDMRYLPGSDRLHCDHCGAEEKIEGFGPWEQGAEALEQDYSAAINAATDAAGMEETKVLTCSNCGAIVEFDPDMHAAECPFCATPVVTGTGSHRHIKPHAVLPFLLSEREARAAMTKWLGKLWLAPSGLSAYARKGRAMSGVYVPYWTYDAATRSSYRGQRGTVYYETRTVRVTVNGQPQTRSKQVAKVRWKPVSGRVARAFDDVLVLASKSLPKDTTDALAPWDLSGLEPYQPEYLAGFRAEAYQLDLQDGFREARSVMDAQIRRDVRFDIGGDRQRIDQLKTEIDDLTFKHVLLPVWLAAYKYRGKSFRFIVNARTGRVQGERPWSAWKVAAATIIGLLLAGAIGFLIARGQ